MAGPELSRSVAQASIAPTQDVFERFQGADIKIAIQKDGSLTEISRAIISDYFDTTVPRPDPSDKRMAAVSDDGRFGYARVRNKDITQLVARRAVDFAVVGVDRLVEDGADDRVEIVETYEDRYNWPLVLAFLEGSDVKLPYQVRRVATQYPRITKRFFEIQGLAEVEVVPTSGSTELFPYLEDEEGSIDAVVDMRVSGSSMRAHNLVEWDTPVDTAFPVLIKPKETGNV